MLISLALPASALAIGPPPPPFSPFWAPATPTPAPLPQASPHQSAIPVDVHIPDPGDTSTQIFLPWIGSAAVSSQAVQPMMALAAITATVAPQHDDPLAASFIYQVKAGDTLSNLAIEFGRDLGTMSCAFGADGRMITTLQAGDSIIVPALSDLCHRVKAGEDLSKIATWYGVSAANLLTTPENHLQTADDLRTGQYLLIPDAGSRYRDPVEVNKTRASNDGWQYGDGEFIWPIERSKLWVSQGFRHGQHMAVDMATRSGAEVMAADTGTVIKVGWNDNGYGYRIVIDHGIDYVTLYAHLSEYYVQEGDVVQKGDVIGVVGSTGNSSGPHLHFEVRDYGYLVDPLLVLPRDR